MFISSSFFAVSGNAPQSMLSPGRTFKEKNNDNNNNNNFGI